MPLAFDTDHHPQLRYTVRLEYKTPVDDKIEAEYRYMTDEEFESERYHSIIDKHKEMIQEEWWCEGEITEWGVRYHQNTFTKSEIFSDTLCNYLKYGRRHEIAPLTEHSSEFEEQQQDIEFHYLHDIQADYCLEDVARAVLRVTRNPKYEYAKKILAIWGVRLRPNYIEYQLRNIINRDNVNDQLAKLLKEITDENLRKLKFKLDHLNKEWNLQHERNAHKCAILVYRFLNDCRLISRTNVSRISMMEIVYSYLGLPTSTYKKDAQLAEPTPKEYEAFQNGEKLSATIKRKCKIYSSIASKWTTFKKARLS